MDPGTAYALIVFLFKGTCGKRRKGLVLKGHWNTTFTWLGNEKGKGGEGRGGKAEETRQGRKASGPLRRRAPVP